ncbi:[Fe-S]-binding protein [Vulcanibacillus modesticaldus]|uniref:Methylated-DNA--protein-cysteine methyltransferase n=1 Tax=Vulcanibacillus modesticaldus TaxID=337097 RepID=A0A1D2YTI1_9BACI|nr:methylated-DNA--[protein]-cysteine S-methyltransferase [Vulcanibacillus modesticaldus]OEF98986.1 [Fe-S]-binding protein [Vulcanibacillus modesticaldus]
MKESSRVVYYTEMDSKIGPLTIAATNKGVCWIDFGKIEDTLYYLQRWAKRWINTEQVVFAQNELDDVKRQLHEYFNRDRKEFDLDVDLYGTPFQKLVWESLLMIPYGEVRTYKDIAIQINSPQSVRAIGGANHNNPVPIIVPCHRVIGSNGNLVGYGGGIEIKKILLELEGYKLGENN